MIPRWPLRGIFARFPRSASQRLGISRKSWRVFHDRSLLGRCYRGFIPPVLKYCSAVWCSAANTHLKQLSRVVSGVRFLTRGVFECHIVRCRSVAGLCMLYTIRCSPMHSLFGALPVPVRVTRGVPVAHRYTYAHPLCRTSQCRKTFILLSVSLWNDPADPLLDGVGLARFKSRRMLIYWHMLLYPFSSFSSFPFLFFQSIGWYYGAGVFGLIGCR